MAGCLLLLIYLHTGSLAAQTLKGRITGTSGEPVIAASLFVKELKFGTSANDDGYYALALTEGTYTCTFQCLGYEMQTKTIAIDKETVTLNILLKERAYEIKEVVISDKNEDPAYGIMRRAIAMTPYYMNQVSEYNADVYLKGSLQLIKLSRLVKRLAKDELKEYKEGNTYMEETFNRLTFTAPNKYQQTVLKRTGNIPQQQEGTSAMQLVTISVYDTKAILPIISPLSSSSFSHYNFRYEGFTEENDRIINKIKIIPRHKSKQLVAGYVYIADNYWNIHSLDISGDFVIGGSYRLQMNFGEVSENVWLPISHNINFNGAILGSKGTFRYNSSVKYTHISENKSIRKPDALLLAEQQRKAKQQSEAPPLSLSRKEKPADKNTAKVEKLLAKDQLSNREAYKLSKLMQKEVSTKDKASLNLNETYYDKYDMKVDSAANERDTAYWAKMRPVPLMPDELKGYRDKEAQLAAAPKHAETKDPAKPHKPQSKFAKTTKKVFLGTNIRLGESGGTIQYRGINPSAAGFNTVDGFYIGQKIGYYKDFGRKQRENRLTITPEAIWAINRKALMWDVRTSFSYAPMHRGNATLRVGQKTTDFNGQSGIYPFEHTISTLFFRRNYMKLYEQSFVQAGNTIDITNGLQVSIHALYSKRTIPENSSNYAFFYRDSRTYDPNIPENRELAYPLSDHTNTSFSLTINYTPYFFYRVDHNNHKRMVKSDYPTIQAGWRKGLKDVFGSDSDFDLISVGIHQSIETGLMQRFRYNVNGGIFVNRKSVHFPDFRHFRTLEIPVTIGGISNRGFNLLPYYRYSTSDKYAEAHLYYSAPFLALKYLPFFSNRLWTEGLQLNYLYTPEMKNYVEVGYTIGLVWQAGIFAGFENFSYRSFGVRLALPLGLLFDELGNE